MAEYLVIDTESCTGHADDGSLCSIGYVLTDENFNEIKKEDVIFNPLPGKFRVGDKKNFKRTGVEFAYSVEEFRKAPRFIEKYKEIRKLFEGKTILGFSMGNDVKYLNDACDSFRLPRISYTFYDIQSLYKLLVPEENAIGLKTLTEKYGITYQPHRSDEDAEVSLLLLKKLLDQFGYTFASLIGKYGVHAGVNDEEGYYLPFSEAHLREEYGLKLSKRTQGVIFNDFVSSLPYPKRSRTTVCFSYKLEKRDIHYLRSLIEGMLEKGYYFTRDFDVCDYFVYDGADDGDKRLALLNEYSAKRKKPIVCEIGKWEETIGFTGAKRYDDTAFLIAKSSEKTR